MARPSTLLWFVLIGIALLPSAAGRIFIDIAGGLMFILLALPILLIGLGWLGLRFLQSRLIKCESCGASIINNSSQCPICGSILSINTENQSPSASINNSIPASSATIDITAKDAGEGTSSQ